MDLKGFSEASRCPFWTLWILRDFEEIYGLFWAVLGGIALGFSQILYRIIKKPYLKFNQIPLENPKVCPKRVGIILAELLHTVT